MFSVKIIDHVSTYFVGWHSKKNRTRIRNRSPRLSASGSIEIM